MRRNYSSFRTSGAYTSPGTPEHCEDQIITAGEIPKTWCSERVPLPVRRPAVSAAAAALLPYSAAGRTLPSKWDDAERWITSPLDFKIQPQRRPKSKSGPLGPPGIVFLPSPGAGNVRSFLAAPSPLTTGVLVPNGLTVHYEAGNAARSNFLFGNEIVEAGAGAGDRDAPVPRRRDVATQMSPDETSVCSSPRGTTSFSNLPSAAPAGDDPAGKDEVRDVEVDRGATIFRQGKKRSTNSTWNINEELNNNSTKFQREVAKIAAWENLQKAKAEAAIHKLEVKLEKKRSASIDKIRRKLVAAQNRARDMRDSLSENPRMRSRKKLSSCIYVGKFGLFLPCFRRR
ncbi:uncharacterized protein LOC127258607 [Andrographis paniculata]|uniref:uncharacterized protein LOC127258607 n=1 Tax=Andrographis paniculata TaxID=175694 RepID=UPI0021E87060|nr:uncharacterized protein LOC127258607 [Andrographis paniculata]